jgi:hypothetical protein
LRLFIHCVEQAVALDPIQHQRVVLAVDHFPGALVVLEHRSPEQLKTEARIVALPPEKAFALLGAAVLDAA